MARIGGMFDAALFVALLCLGCLVAHTVGRRLADPRLGRLLVLGVLMRALGSEVRIAVLEYAYNGVGDARGYLGWGSRFRDLMLNLEWEPLFNPYNSSWWGTHFIRIVSGLLQIVLGANFHTLTLAFSFFGYAGLVLIAISFLRHFGRRQGYEYLFWLVLWPSLWYWPSSIGKDSLMLLAIGLTTYGYSAYSRPKWLPIVVGCCLAMCIRPHITIAFAAAMALGEWVGRRRTSNLRVLAVLVVAGIAAVLSLSLFGLGAADIEGIEEEFERYASRTRRGGSQIEAVSGPLAIPMALVNVLLRPFPWEAHHMLALASGLEMWGIWLFLAANRAKIIPALSLWKRSRFLRFGLFVTLLISLLYGLAFANMGIIVRQRVVILPFLFVILAFRGGQEPSPDETALPP